MKYVFKFLKKTLEFTLNKIYFSVYFIWHLKFPRQNLFDFFSNEVKEKYHSAKYEVKDVIDDLYYCSIYEGDLKIQTFDRLVEKVSINKQKWKEDFFNRT